MKVLSWIITLPLAVVCIALAVANRHLVRLNLDPLPFVFEARLTTVMLSSFMAGILVGLIFARIRGIRRQASVSRRQVRRLAKESARHADEGVGRDGLPPTAFS